MKSNTFFLLVGVFVGCALADLDIFHTPYSLDGLTKFNEARNYTSLGGQFGWKLSWNISGTSQSSLDIGPMRVINKDGVVLSSFLASIRTMGSSAWSDSNSAYDTIDPCVHPLPRNEEVFTTLQLENKNVTGDINVTVAYTSLYVIGNNPNINRTNVALSCLGVECKVFYFFNATTEHKNYSVEFNITSPDVARVTYAYGSGHCPTVPSANVHNASLPIKTTVTILIENESQIWLMFDGYKDRGDVNWSFAEVTWRILPKEDSFMNHKLMWGLIISGIVAAVIIVIIVVVVIRKKRTNYIQV